MLGNLPSDPARPSTYSARLCTICDGVEAVARLASYLALRPPAEERLDLGMSEALDRLKTQSSRRFDEILLALGRPGETLPHLLQAVLAEAERHSDRITLLLPPGAEIPIMESPCLTLRHGPPFAAAGLVSKGAERIPDDLPRHPAGLMSRLLARHKRSARPAPQTEGNGTQDEKTFKPAPLRLIALQPLCGGSGATTVCVNLAVELALQCPKATILLLDLNLQFGNVATYLDLPQNSRILDAYRNIKALDAEAFDLCLQNPRPNLHVFASPAEVLPLDGITAAEVGQLLRLARERADLVLLDLPQLLPDWAETAFREADRILAVGPLSVRSAQNAAKLRDLLGTRNPIAARMLPILNFVPKKTDRDWRAAKQAYEKGWGKPVFWEIPDGGAAIAAAGNLGAALCLKVSRNPMRLAIRDLAQSFAAALPMRAKFPAEPR